METPAKKHTEVVQRDALLSLESFVRSVVGPVATVRGVDTMDLPPLSDAVDVERLVSILGSMADAEGEGTLRFEYARSLVDVSVGGRVSARSLASPDESRQWVVDSPDDSGAWIESDLAVEVAE
ncbi:MAG: HalOD1 output domain-containing protein [Halosimplex sp.]